MRSATRAAFSALRALRSTRVRRLPRRASLRRMVASVVGPKLALPAPIITMLHVLMRVLMGVLLFSFTKWLAPIILKLPRVA